MSLFTDMFEVIVLYSISDAVFGALVGKLFPILAYRHVSAHRDQVMGNMLWLWIPAPVFVWSGYRKMLSQCEVEFGSH